MPETIKASLVIPSYNREELLVGTLRCAFAQDCPGLEILLIDQTRAHEPATDSFLAENGGRFIHVRPDFASVTKARNEGLRRARGEVIVFIDDDVSFEPGFVSAHLAAHADGTHVVQGRVTEQGSRQPSRPTWLTGSLRFKGGDNYDRDGITNNITGCNFSIRREVIERIGLFDENFKGVSVREESDYARRAYKAGLSFKFSAAAALFHHRSVTGGVGTGVKNNFFEKSYYYCELMFAKKHFPAWTVFTYRIRLYLRGFKNLRRLIQAAEKEADEAVKSPKER
ncbi:MAG TPA: glycosyltransferase family 2 protein [Gammaproteobacteria bacterium]|nr:glycosyltransferase family 2 protein [Gammaproteobacteria bacterium]